MTGTLGTTLSLVLLAQSAIPVILRQPTATDESATAVVLISEGEARTQYNKLSKLKRHTPEQEALFAALTISLGTIPSINLLPANNTPEFRTNEVRRGVRTPARGSN